MTAFASMLWQRYRVTATSSPALLRWNACDYRDAADLAFAHDPKMQADLRSCANDMEAAAWLLDLHHGGASRPARAAAGATDGVVACPGSRPAAVVDPSSAPAGGTYPTAHLKGDGQDSAQGTPRHHPDDGHHTVARTPAGAADRPRQTEAAGAGTPAAS